MLTLSMASIVIRRTLGRRLNCITAIHMPPKSASTVRLRSSAAAGLALRFAISAATCGQMKPLSASTAHHGIGASCRRSTDATHSAPRPRPSVRSRWMRFTKRSSRTRCRSAPRPAGAGNGESAAASALPGAAAMRTASGISSSTLSCRRVRTGIVTPRAARQPSTSVSARSARAAHFCRTAAKAASQPVSIVSQMQCPLRPAWAESAAANVT